MLLSFVLNAEEIQPHLKVIYQGKSKELSLAELKSKYKQVEIDVKRNPAHEGVGTQDKRRKYRGVRLTELLKNAMPKDAKFKDHTVIFKCDDGYKSKIDLRFLEGKLAVVAFAQDVSDFESYQISKDKIWELITMPNKKVSPGPFYVVWDTPRETYPEGWAFQLVEMEIVKSDQVPSALSGSGHSK